MPKLKALRTFEGNEGLISRGDVFEVENQERADQLVKLQLAEEAPADAEVTNFQQKNEELNDMTKEQLVKVAEAEGVTYRDGATKQEIKQAILDKREAEYLTQTQQQTAVYGQSAAPSEPDANPDSDGSGNDTESGGA